MIRYALKCDQGHGFESWFQNAQAYDSLSAAGHVVCVVCGSGSVDKAVMAPRVAAGRAVDAAKPDAPTPEAAALQKMTRHVEENADYVGGDFVREARAMHLGESPERSIYGEARPAEAKALIEDGVPVLPLPFVPKAKAN